MKFSPFYGSRWFVTFLITARHLCRSRANINPSVKICFNLILVSISRNAKAPPSFMYNSKTQPKARVPYGL